MEARVKRYSVVIRGRVQDMGFRDLVTQMANFLRLKGYVFNDVDGSVKLVLEGAKDALDSFLEEVKTRTRSIGAEIESLTKKEVSRDIDLPPKFVKIPTTELEEIGRKLDIGVLELRDIKNILGGHTSLLKGMQEGQQKMVVLLERIAEK